VKYGNESRKSDSQKLNLVQSQNLTLAKFIKIIFEFQTLEVLELRGLQYFFVVCVSYYWSFLSVMLDRTS